MLYPLNEQMEQLMESWVDPETGELLPEITDEVMKEQVEKLEIDFDATILSIRNSYMTTMVNANCIKAEASELYRMQQEVSKRAKTELNKAERKKRLLAYLLHGEKYDKNGCKISYRKSEETKIEDGFINWALNNRPDLLSYDVKTSDIKAAIKSGSDIEFAYIEQKNNIQVK